MTPTIPEIAPSDPWWAVALKILAPVFSLVITVGLPILIRKGLQALDAWRGWNTEERGMRVAQRLVLAGEQMVRKVIAEDLADGKITKEEASFRIKKLAEETASSLAAEIGVSAEAAERFVEAAVLATGVSKSGKGNARVTAKSP